MEPRRLNSSMPSVFDPIPARDTTPVASERVYGGSQSGNSTRVQNQHFVDADRAWSASSVIWIIVVPIVVAVILLALLPTFVEMDGNRKVDKSSLILWTCVITLIIWILFWGFSKCKTC